MQINADLHSPEKFILNQFTNLILILHIKSNLRKKSIAPGGGAKILSSPVVKFLHLLMIHM